MTTDESKQTSNHRSDEDAVSDIEPVERSFLGELWKYSILIGMGGLIALLSSYLVRQFGY